MLARSRNVFSMLLVSVTRFSQGAPLVSRYLYMVPDMSNTEIKLDICQKGPLQIRAHMQGTSVT